MKHNKAAQSGVLTGALPSQQFRQSKKFTVSVHHSGWTVKSFALPYMLSLGRPPHTLIDLGASATPK